MFKSIAIASMLLLLTGCVSVSKEENAIDGEVQVVSNNKDKPQSLLGDVKLKQQSKKTSLQNDEITQQTQTADRFYKERDFEKAQQAYEQLLKLDPKQSIAYYRLGNISFRKKEYKRASFYFSKSLEIMPSNDKARYNLAMTFLTLAEQNFNAYKASLPSGQNHQEVNRLLAEIENFSGDSQSSSVESVDRNAQSEIDHVQPPSSVAPTATTSDDERSSLDELAKELE